MRRRAASCRLARRYCLLELLEFWTSEISENNITHHIMKQPLVVDPHSGLMKLFYGKFKFGTQSRSLSRERLIDQRPNSRGSRFTMSIHYRN